MKVKRVCEVGRWSMGADANLFTRKFDDVFIKWNLRIWHIFIVEAEMNWIILIQLMRYDRLSFIKWNFPANTLLAGIRLKPPNWIMILFFHFFSGFNDSASSCLGVLAPTKLSTLFSLISRIELCIKLARDRDLCPALLSTT